MTEEDGKTNTSSCISERWETGTFPVIEIAPDGNRFPDVDPTWHFQVLEDNGDTMTIRYLVDGPH